MHVGGEDGDSGPEFRESSRSSGVSSEILMCAGIMKCADDNDEPSSRGRRGDTHSHLRSQDPKEKEGSESTSLSLIRDANLAPAIVINRSGQTVKLGHVFLLPEQQAKQRAVVVVVARRVKCIPLASCLLARRDHFLLEWHTGP